MQQPPPDADVAVLFSGGIDSAILVANELKQGQRVRPLYIDSGLYWQREELRAARAFLEASADPKLLPLVVLQMPMADILVDHWAVTGREVPDAHSPDSAVYMPGRNPLLTIKADIWCRLHGIPALALGSLRSNPFADATEEFFARFSAVLDCAMPGRVRIMKPLSGLDKREAVQLGRHLPLELTFSCLAPIDGLHCGGCNKCAERAAAFTALAMPDPTRYAAR